jgi:hypothetical protein
MLLAFLVAGVDQAYTTVGASANYLPKFANISSAAISATSAAGPLPSQAAFNATTAVTWQSRSTVSNLGSNSARMGTVSAAATAGSSLTSSQSSAQQMFFCRVCMIGCAGAQVGQLIGY